MTTFNTGNPIGSTDARDLSDNAENFDTALGSTASTWVDRFGVTRDSFEGRLAKGSFYRAGTFSAGYTLTNMRQTLEYSGHEYSWAGTFPKVVAAGATPATSGGIGAGAWVDRTESTLRGELITGAMRSRGNSISLRDFVSVLDFGALGDGIHDSTSAFNQAIATGRGVFVPSGTYLVNQLNLISGCKLYGEGASSIIKPLLNTSPYAIGGISPSASEYISDVNISHINFIGSVAVDGFREHSHLLSFNGFKNLTVSNCGIKGFRGDGIYLGSGIVAGDERHNINVKIFACDIDGINKNNRNGISIIDGRDIDIFGNSFSNTTSNTMPGAIDIEPDSYIFHVIKNIKIHENTFKNIGGNVGCICTPFPPVNYTIPPRGIHVFNNTIESCESNALHFSFHKSGGVTDADDALDVKWYNNNVIAASRPFSVIGAKDISIEGNIFESCPKTALFGYTSQDYAVLDACIKNNRFNKCAETDRIALSLFTINRVSIKGNVFNDCGNGLVGSYAIDFSVGSSSYITLSENTFISPTGKTLIAVQKEAVHTFSTSTNTCNDNTFNGLSNNFKAENSSSLINTYTPVVGGTTTDGRGTYTVQNGQFSRIGNIVFFSAKVVTTSHTGTGEIELSIPDTSMPQSSDPWFFMCNGTASNGSYSGVVSGYLSTAADVSGSPSAAGGAIRFRTSSGGAITVANAMTINVSGFYFAKAIL